MSPAHLPALLALTLFLSSSAAAQIGGAAKLPSGSSTQTIRLKIPEPLNKGDRFVVNAFASGLGISLMAPGGLRVTSLDWNRSPFEPALGSTDGGESIMADVDQAYPAGEYILEFTARELAKPTEVHAYFVSERAERESISRPMSGGPSPVTVQLSGEKRSGELELSVTSQETASFIDLLVSDPGVRLQLTLPDGTVVSETAAPAGITWKRSSAEEMQRGSGMIFDFYRITLPGPGTHHFVALEKALPGRYRIQAALPGDQPATVTATFVHISRLLETPLRAPAVTAHNEIALQPYASGSSEAIHAGGNIDLTVGFENGGDVDAASLQFAVRLEYRAAAPEGAGPSKFGPPVLEHPPVAFRKNAQGLYQSRVVAAGPGQYRAAVRAAGRRKNGQPFSTGEVTWSTIFVLRTVARFLSVSETAIDTDGNGTFDRLEISGRIQVLEPGRFYLSAAIDSPSGGSLRIMPDYKVLAVGEQTLTIAIPAKDLRASSLGDGPWTIRSILIGRSKDNTFGEIVATPRDLTLATRPYTIQEWRRGTP